MQLSDMLKPIRGVIELGNNHRDRARANCGAKTRSGAPCKNPPVNGKRRCRMHGGAAGSGGQKGNKNALKHGFWTHEAVAERKWFRSLLKEVNKNIIHG